MNKAYVRVRLDGWKYEWRTVLANNLDHALELARAMPDVINVLEVSWIPGGVVT
jgi:hypothetical protein